ncbi:hypothetical protein U14_05491 [Candidatus Moduliflexus flocculans]|uniref:DUF3782 domain-containing protein n=1 Tax=Candidatus Moduliflexus flocculans TaxID=1499966 RepID=A0A081BS31_9BACT|nr:hypothetical protein U14_05491 [Candidatus Moduliflexus flocculans]
MPATTQIQTIRKIILSELPTLIESDPAIRSSISRIGSERYADRRQTDNHIDRILNELKEDRERSEQRWQEDHRTIQEMLAEIKQIKTKHEASIGALGARWGLQSESAFRNGLRAILENSFHVNVERYADFDQEGLVFGRPDQVELDVIIFNGTVILCELKSSMSKSDMYAFWRKAQFYEKQHQRRADRLLAISPMIDDKAKQVAKELQIETYSYSDEVVI